MKKYLFLLVMAVIGSAAFTQPVKKTPPKEKAPSPSEVNKMMEDAMKDMSEEEKNEMRKMMKDVMPEMTKKPGSDAIAFTDNKKLIPVKDVNRINSISKKAFTDADAKSNTSMLYSKLMLKIAAEEKSIIDKVLSQANTGSAFMSAATTALLQGHYQSAMALAMKAVLSDPENVLFQNNLAAILSQSGYPENAIPYLKKLAVQLPGNSTVLNNLGYAWFALGEMDTAKRYFAYAAVRNPNHPEANLCLGLIEELKGDPKKASEDYVKSFQEIPNPFAESLIKNVKGGDPITAMDFENFKSKMTIHEYFKKDWIKIPALSDSVSGYEKDMAVKNGYEKMFEALLDSLNLMAEASSEEIEKLADKGEAEFVKTMMKESMKGLNMMSMPAVYVQKILQAYVYKWTENYTKEYDSLRTAISIKRKEITKAGNNDKCKDYDRKNDEYMAYANPLIRKFFEKKIEEFRSWLNAFCTWSWYITGNPKNVVLTQCIGWTHAIVEMYRSAIHDQEAIAQTCVKQNGDGALSIAAPLIPNFTCPVVVRIPIGLDKLSLSPQAVNFDNNYWNIKLANGATIPHVTIGMSLGDHSISEPGKYGNPYIKTGNGSVNASGANYGDSDGDELMPLSKIIEELTALPKIQPDQLTPLDPTLLNPNKKLTGDDLKKIQSAELGRRLLSKMMSTECEGTVKKKPRNQKFEVGIGEIVFEDIWDEERGLWIDPDGNPRPPIVVTLGELVLEDVWHTADNSHGPGFVVGIGELILEDVSMNGPQPVINNGVGKKAEGFVRDLFK